jgi:hypothetical protein
MSQKGKMLKKKEVRGNKNGDKKARLFTGGGRKGE